jgi:hypothetical protein
MLLVGGGGMCILGQAVHSPLVDCMLDCNSENLVAEM